MLKEKLLLLPNKPGCYLMKDKNGVIIYVGKAKNLKNRVNSYFKSSQNIWSLLLLCPYINKFELGLLKSYALSKNIAPSFEYSFL